MKKLILSLIASVSVALGAYADSGTWTIANGAMSNLLSSPVKITQIIYQSTSTNTTQFSAVDSPSATFTNIIAGFSTITQKATNYITTYTNFFGVSNSFTNLALISATNTIPAQTNIYPTQFTLFTATNSQARVDNANFYFINGFTVTNSGAGPVTITVNYNQ